MTKPLTALLGGGGDGDPQRVVPDADVLDGELLEDVVLAAACPDDEGDDE
jgi:hypothetical protein